MGVLLQITDLLGVYLEFADILVESEEVFAGTLEAESLVVVREGVAYLLNVVLVGEEMNEPFID